MPSPDWLGLAIKIPFVTPESQSYRPPSWPPPRDWICIEDADGEPISRWGDPIWHLYPWAGKTMTLNFGDGHHPGRARSIDRDNADILRLLVTWRGWGPRGARNAHTLKSDFFKPMRAIVALCSSEGILVSDLMRFPAIVAKVPNVLMPSKYQHAIVELQRVLDAKDELGFVILDKNGIRQISMASPGHNPQQTEYIPPRIWVYQLNRLRECLNDYIAHRQGVEDCFHFCVDAYAHNYGSLAAALTTKTIDSKNPFNTNNVVRGKEGGYFPGSFHDIAVRFGILELLGRWVGELDINGRKNRGISRFSSYLSLVQVAGLAYVLNLTFMRYSEGKSLRADCLSVEDDDNLGKVHILCGETTKTDPDSDARWPTSPSISVAIDAMASVSGLRMRCAKANPLVAPSVEAVANPYLFDRAFEPWAGHESKRYSVRPVGRHYASVYSQYPRLFEMKILTITEADLRLARSVTPTLSAGRFQVGKVWPLAWHQLRRSGAVNMFSSGLVSNTTMQFQMKHLTMAMTLYYGRGNSFLTFNDNARALLINAQYEAMGREIVAVLSDRFVSPHGDSHKKKMIAEMAGLQDEVNIIGEKDAKRFADAARRGTISFRITILGGCMSKNDCNGDCIESIADCAGGDGGAFCKDVLFDRQRAEKNQKMLDGINFQIESIPLDTPRYRALEKEKRGLENYFAFINSEY